MHSIEELSELMFDKREIIPLIGNTSNKYFEICNNYIIIKNDKLKSKIVDTYFKKFLKIKYANGNYECYIKNVFGKYIFEIMLKSKNSNYDSGSGYNTYVYSDSLKTEKPNTFKEYYENDYNTLPINLIIDDRFKIHLNKIYNRLKYNIDTYIEWKILEEC